MIKEIQAKTLLSTTRNPAAWFGVRYVLNIYRGCEHRCIYCDSRSDCYRIEDFNDVLVKVNALELLRRELRSKRLKGTVGTGAMSDPYTPAERTYNLTGRALEIIAELGYAVHITTKSDLVLRDLETLRTINRTWASVFLTVTTADDDLARKLEPGAPSPARRFAAMKALAEAGICTGTALMPVLPFIEDQEANIAAIVERTCEAGGRYIVPWFGMSLRDRQRAYYYEQLDRLFPGLSEQYRRCYGERYSCPAPNARALQRAFEALCARYGIAATMAQGPQPAVPKQLPLL
jgi:DNA repair photolyase